MKLTDFELLEVVTEDGARLGHVFDLRAHGRPTLDSSQSMGPVDELVYGTLGLLERLGIRRAEPKTMPWREVTGVRDGALIVRRAPATPPRR